MITVERASVGLAAVIASGLLLGGCGTDADDVTSAEAKTVASRDFYSDVELPASRPAGLTYVKVDQYKSPETAGQYVQLIFGDRTVYVCSPGVERPSTAPGCPMPEKSPFRTAGSGDAETVYATGDVDGKTSSASGEVTEGLRDAELTTSPQWFVEMLEDQGTS